MFVRRELRQRLRSRDEFVATVTKKAIDRLLRNASDDGTISIEAASVSTDERGRQLVTRHVVGRVPGVAALKGGDDVLASVERPYSAVVDSLIFPLDERVERLAALTAPEAVAAEKDVRSLISSEIEASSLNERLAGLLSQESLITIGRWGAHADCPHPFWVARFGADLHAGKGIKPLKSSGTKRLSLI